jgi:hypothetical protein
MMKLQRLVLAFGICAALGAVTPALATHNHPKTANKHIALLVTSYVPCTLPDTAHNPSIAIPGCTGVTPTSNGANALHFGPKGKGQGLLVVTGTPDVKIVAKISDVRDSADQPFNGSLLSYSSIQITDHNCAPVASGNMCTDVSFPFPVTLTCVNGTCKATTFANTAVPGSILPGAQANVGLGPLTVNDPDGNAAFVAGLFIP